MGRQRGGDRNRDVINCVVFCVSIGAEGAFSVCLDSLVTMVS